MGTIKNYRLTRAILTAAIAVGLAGLHSPAHALVSGDFNYYPDGDTVVISGWAPDTCPVGTLVIPSTIASKPVSRIDSTTFSGRTCFSLGNPTTSVSIPSSVTSIGERAFKNSPALTSLSLSSGLTTIETEAFANTGLTSLNLPASVTDVGEKAFFANSSLSSVTFNGNTTVAAQAFKDASSLATVNFSPSQNVIGQSSFEATAIVNLTIPAALNSIGSSAFANIPELKTVTFLGDPLVIRQGTFSGDTGIQRITFNSHGAYLPTGSEAFTGVNTATAFVLRKAGTQVHAVSGFTAWGETYGGIRTAVAPTVSVGNGAKKVAKKSITLKPIMVSDSTGTVAVTVTSRVKTKSGYSTRVWCSYSRAVTPKTLVETNCKMGKTARNLLKKSKQTYTVNFTFTQAVTGLPVTQSIKVSLKRKR